MIKLFCDKCGSILEENKSLTLASYDREFVELFSEDGSLYTNTEMNYLLFVCNKCGFHRKVNISLLTEMIRRDLIEIVANNRVSAAVPTIDRRKVKEENGVSYCGICFGVIDDSGYCYNDVISQCKVRKTKLDDK